jgi:hypothetical protein
MQEVGFAVSSLSKSLMFKPIDRRQYADDPAEMSWVQGDKQFTGRDVMDSPETSAS